MSAPPPPASLRRPSRRAIGWPFPCGNTRPPGGGGGGGPGEPGDGGGRGGGREGEGATEALAPAVAAPFHDPAEGASRAQLLDPQEKKVSPRRSSALARSARYRAGSARNG